MSASLSYIERPHLLRQIDFALAKDVAMVVLEGPEGIGKTSLLHEYCRYRPDHSAYFASGIGRASSHPGFACELLCMTLFPKAGMTLPPVHEHLDEAKLAEAVRRLVRKARAADSQFVLCVDGLEHVPAERHADIGMLLDMIPLGVPGFRLLVGGLPIGITLRQDLARSITTASVSFLSDAEVVSAFGSLVDTEEKQRIVIALTDGIPAKVESLYLAICSRGQDALGVTATDISDFYQIEWQSTDALTDNARLALALLADPLGVNSREHLKTAAQLTNDDVSAILSLGFVEQSGDLLRFRNDSFLRFASVQSKHLDQEVNDCLVRFFESNQDIDPVLERLSSLYTRADRSSDLLRLLSENKVAALVRGAHSLDQVLRTLQLGAAAAIQTEQLADAVQFGLQSGSISDYVRRLDLEPEIRARVALGDLDGAIALANSERLTEGRFASLAIVLKACDEFGRPLPPALVDDTRRLFDALPEDSLHDEAIGIAANLLFVLPELAIRLLTAKAALRHQTQDLDRVLVTLGLAARVQDLATPEGASTLQGFQSSITSPSLKQLFESAETSSQGIPAERVISRARQLENTRDRVFLYENWIEGNRRRADAHLVLDAALTLCTTTASFSPNARTYRRLAACLPYIAEDHRRHYYCDLITNQLGTLSRTGPAIDAHQLRVLLARVIFGGDQVRGRDAFEGAFLLCLEDKDPLARLTGLSALKAALVRDDKTGALESISHLHSDVGRELQEAIGMTLTSTAEQADAVRACVGLLASPCPEDAVALATSLNTYRRRDDALSAFVRGHVTQAVAEWSLPHLTNAFAKMADPRSKDRAIQRLSRQLRADDSQPLEWDRLAAILPLLRQPVDLRNRAIALARGVGALAPEVAASRAHDIAKECFALCDEIEDLATAREAQLEVISLLAAVLPALAAAQLSRLQEVTSAPRNAEDSVAPAEMCLRLAVRALVGLLRAHVLTGQDALDLAREIDVRSTGASRIRMHAYLTCGVALADLRDIARQLAEEYLVPTITKDTRDERYRCTTVVDAAPALALAGLTRVLTTAIALLPAPIADRAIEDAVRAIAFRCLPNDPVAVRIGYPSMPSMEDALLLLAFAEAAYFDQTCYGILGSLLECLQKQEFSHDLSNPQRATVNARIVEVAKNAFPSKTEIKHEGYRILVDAMLLRGQARHIDDTAFDALWVRAAQLPNAADAAFVCAFLVSHATGRRYAPALKAARESASALASVADRIDRLESLARFISDRDSGAAKGIVREALTLCTDSQASSVQERRNRLIELGYSIDPEFGAAYASMSDEDGIARAAKEQQLSQDRKAKLTRREYDELPQLPARDTARLFWNTLGDLNADRMRVASPAFLGEAARKAFGMSVWESYPLLSFALQSEVKRVGEDRARASELLHLLYLATLRGMRSAYLAESATNDRYSDLSRQQDLIRSDQSASRSLLLSGPDDLAAAETRIRDWLANVDSDQLFIIDPFVDNSVVRFMRLIAENERVTEVVLVTTIDRATEQFGADRCGALIAAWSKAYEEPPPATRIAMCQTKKAGKSPFHDRWWFAGDRALKFGTSLNGLGRRISTMDELSVEDARTQWSEVAGYCQQREREYEGEKLEYATAIV